MGWDFSQGASKQDIIAELTTDTENRKFLAKSVRSNVLWTVEKYKLADKEDTIIGCYLLASERGFGWGSKSMCESMHPYQYNCPLKFLGMAPEASAEWREKVRAFHIKQAAKQANVKAIKVGCKIRLTDSCTIRGQKVTEPLTVTSIKPIIAHDPELGLANVRVCPRHIAEVLP